MRLAYLGSGSRGNAALIEHGDTLVMLDCGFSATETEKRLRRSGREPGDVNAVLVTHEHSDHASGVLRFAARHQIPVFLTRGTAWAIRAQAYAHVRYISAHEPFEVGSVTVRPLPVPHDAREPCQFVFEADAQRLGVLTDAGHLTAHLCTALADCDGLAVECNHDADMLAVGPYPAALKRRVGGALGHLSNSQAAQLVALQDRARLQWLVGVHLSEQNNTPLRAREALNAALGHHDTPVFLAEQETGLDWLELVR
ncbi:MAG: MBL fold metallo-hydrolase [Gammaproteobacteria bacterium]|nr:MBL fold metallo-hydrolase [Gammaproteobacteria bacterium]